MYLRNYGLRKTLLENCLISLVSEDPSKGNMENGPKQCSNLDSSIFTILIDHCGGNSNGKCIF